MQRMVEILRSMLKDVGYFHAESSVTCLEILRAIVQVKKEEDVIIISKGHSAPALYAMLYELGLLNWSDLMSFAEIDGLPSHVARGVPWVVVSSGSLGQGLSIANGIALAARIKGEERKVYVILGDGELDEGQVWEAAMTAFHYSLDNVVVIVDRNYAQLTGYTEDTMRKEPLVDKWRAFGWEVFTVKNDREELFEVLSRLRKNGRPKAVIAKSESQ